MIRWTTFGTQEKRLSETDNRGLLRYYNYNYKWYEFYAFTCKSSPYGVDWVRLVGTLSVGY